MGYGRRGWNLNHGYGDIVHRVNTLAAETSLGKASFSFPDFFSCLQFSVHFLNPLFQFYSLSSSLLCSVL